MKTAINTKMVWEANQHLNFGEIRGVVAIAEQALKDALWKATQKKIAQAPYQTGYFGVPGGYGGKVHVVQNGKPVCGTPLPRKSEFQWCAHGIERQYVECERCMAFIRSITFQNK